MKIRSIVGVVMQMKMYRIYLVSPCLAFGLRLLAEAELVSGISTEM